MRPACPWPALAAAALVVATLAGCATPYSQGLVAAGQGRYAEASVLYEEALARKPDRLDAIVQLGIVRYKLGALDGAIELLERARTRAPAEPSVRFFLALAYLRKNELPQADEHLTTFIGLKPDRRVAAQAERTIAMIRSGPLSEETRAFAASSLENAADLADEVDAWRALESERWSYWGPYPYPYRYPYPYPPGPYAGCWWAWRSGWLRCY
jgi:tetratricopeptide (TPR) repeat protein